MSTVVTEGHEVPSQKPIPTEQLECFCSKKCFGVGIYLYPEESENTGTDSAFKAAALLDHHRAPSPPRPVPFCCYQRRRQKGRIVTHAQNTGMCKWLPHDRDENIFQDRHIKVPHIQAIPHRAAHNWLFANPPCQWPSDESSQTLQVPCARANGLNISALISMIFN